MSGDLEMLGRVVGGLIVVLVAIGLAARVARRARGESGGSGLKIVERIGLSREANLAVVEISDRKLLLGITAQGVTMLADFEGKQSAPVDEQAVGARTVIPQPSANGRPTPGAIAGFMLARLRHQLGLKPTPVDAGQPTETAPSAPAGRRSAKHGRRRSRKNDSAPVSAPENIDLDEMRETEDAAAQLAAMFGSPSPEAGSDVSSYATSEAVSAPATPADDLTRDGDFTSAATPVPAGLAPVDALLIDVRDSVDGNPSPSVDLDRPAKTSGRRAAGPPIDSAPRSRAENRASLRKAAAEDDTTPLPGTLNADEYPDLASALRAAGRTATEEKAELPKTELPKPKAPKAPEPVLAPAERLSALRNAKSSADSSFIPDSPAALMETDPGRRPRSVPAPASHRPGRAPSATGRMMPKPPAPRRPAQATPATPSQQQARSRAEVRASRQDSLSERTARQVAAFQAEAYPANSTNSANPTPWAHGRQPAPRPSAPRSEGRSAQRALREASPAQPQGPVRTTRPQGPAQHRSQVQDQSAPARRAPNPTGRTSPANQNGPAGQLPSPRRAATQAAQPTAPRHGTTPAPEPVPPTGRRSQQQNPQVNGSVLSPKTWRQGVDALRDLTVRRG